MNCYLEMATEEQTMDGRYLDSSLQKAMESYVETGSPAQMIKNELKLKIQSSRLAAGKKELPVPVFKEPEKHPLTEEEQKRKDKQRERNRIAALKCRNKKKNQEVDMVSIVEVLDKKNTDLKRRVAEMEEEKMRMIRTAIELNIPLPNSVDISGIALTTTSESRPCLTPAPQPPPTPLSADMSSPTDPINMFTFRAPSPTPLSASLPAPEETPTTTAVSFTYNIPSPTPQSAEHAVHFTNNSGSPIPQQVSTMAFPDTQSFTFRAAPSTQPMEISLPAERFTYSATSPAPRQTFPAVSMDISPSAAPFTYGAPPPSYYQEQQSYLEPISPAVPLSPTPTFSSYLSQTCTDENLQQYLSADSHSHATDHNTTIKPQVFQFNSVFSGDPILTFDPLQQSEEDTTSFFPGGGDSINGFAKSNEQNREADISDLDLLDEDGLSWFESGKIPFSEMQEDNFEETVPKTTLPTESTSERFFLPLVPTFDNDEATVPVFGSGQHGALSPTFYS